MSMLGTEAPPAGFPQGAFFNCMSRLVSAAPEAIRELGLGSMSPLAQDGAALQVILPWFYVGWSLSSENTRDMLTTWREGGCHRRRWGAGDKEVLLQTSANGARGKPSLYCKQLSLCTILLFVQLQALPLDTNKGVMVRPESVYVGQDPRISKVDECSVDKEAGSVSRMEDVEVSVLDPTTVEIGGGICLSIEWSGVLGFTLALSAD